MIGYFIPCPTEHQREVFDLNVRTKPELEKLLTFIRDNQLISFIQLGGSGGLTHEEAWLDFVEKFRKAVTYGFVTNGPIWVKAILSLHGCWPQPVESFITKTTKMFTRRGREYLTSGDKRLFLLALSTPLIPDSYVEDFLNGVT